MLVKWEVELGLGCEAHSTRLPHQLRVGAGMAATKIHTSTLLDMADEQTPQPEPPIHETPSLPASPLPKRTKYTEAAPNLTVSCKENT